MQSPISGKINVATKTNPKFKDPTKKSSPHNEKTTQITLKNWNKEIGMCTDQDQTMTSFKSTNKILTLTDTPLGLPYK